MTEGSRNYSVLHELRPEDLPVPFLATDAAGRIVLSNKAAVELWGGGPGTGQWEGSWVIRTADGTILPDGFAASLSMKGVVSGSKEAVVQRPDGSRLRLLIFSKPIHDRENLPAGAAHVIINITPHDLGRQVEQLLASIVESSHDAIVSRNLDGTVTSWNRAAEELYGYAAHEIIGRPHEVLLPRDHLDEEKAITERVRSGGRVEPYETTRVRKDGSLVHISLTASPLRDVNGTIVGMSKIARDITELRRAREHEKLLLGEMSHRAKNILAVAGGLVALAARGAQTPKEMVKSVHERLGAYSRAHDLTRPGLIAGEYASGRPTTLHALMDAILAPYVEHAEPTAEPNIAIDGSDVAVDGNAATNLALVLHEFATNSAKYGSLSRPDGKVRIACCEKGEGISIRWEESGGPAIATTPKSLGFGTLLTRRTVEGQLGGTIDYAWRSGGVVITLELPLARLCAPQT
jgi:PAS domain S-box-containing protein